jgi:MFS transporter, ACS family, tartrate transporter
MATSPAVAPSAIEATTIRKLRTRIVPFIFLLYIVAFLDRINIGFAALTMNKELAINSQQFGLLAGVFFFGYFIFEIPSNLLLHKIGARFWIARILISWGIVAAMTGFVQNVPQLYIARFMLGLMEAGYFPGILLYLTYWFPQREQARAISLFMAAIPVTYIVAAPVSGLILDHVHWLTISSWRWLLILEGVPAIICGVLTYFFLPSRPSEATFLTQDEKGWITAELTGEQRGKAGEHSTSALPALSHRRVWYLACASLMFQTGHYVVYFWMPQAVKSLSILYSNTVVGLLVMVPYLAGLVAMVAVSRSSDRRLERRFHAAVPLIVGGIALTLLSTLRSPLLTVTLWSFAVMGVLSVLGPFWSLPNEFVTGASAASGIAVITSFGSLGGFVGPYVFGVVTYGTRNFRSLAIVSIPLFLSAMLILALGKRSEQQAMGEVSMVQPNPAAVPTADVD